MAKKANPTPSRTCADCFHFSACHLWAVSISTDVAPECPQFEPARYSSLADLHEMHQMAKGELVPVVRCRECEKFWKYTESHKATVEKADGDCMIRCMVAPDDPQFCAVQKDDYCSMGKRKYATNMLDKPGCYGHYRTRDSRAMCDCESCELEYECEQAAKERWGGL